MPMVNGKKYPYTKEGMNAAKKAAKKKMPSRSKGMMGSKSSKMMNRKPGRMR